MADLDDLATGAAATLEQIQAMSRKIESLTDRQIEAEDAFLYRVKTLYSEGYYTLAHLRSLSEQYCPAYFQRGWEERWEDAELPALGTIMDLWVESIQFAPNRPHGSWSNYDPLWDDDLPDFISSTPSLENPMPPRGQNVVYVLYDASSKPCYVGSSGNFPARLKWHLKDGKPVAVWIAYPCDSREAAYALEDRLLKQHKPYLNKRAGA